MTKQENQKAYFGTLSPREIDVLKYASEGLLDKEICVKLGITVNTLRTYWQRIRSKVGNWTRVHLVTWYLRTESDLDVQRLVWPALRQWVLVPNPGPLKTFKYRTVSNGIFSSIHSCKLHPDSMASVYEVISRMIDGEASEAFLEHQIIVDNLTYDSHAILQIQRDDTGEITAITGFSVDRKSAVQDMVLNHGGSWTNVFEYQPFVADDNLCKMFEVDGENRTSLRHFLRKVCKHYRNEIYSGIREASRNNFCMTKIPFAILRNGERIELKILAIFASGAVTSTLCGGEVYDLSTGTQSHKSQAESVSA